MATEVDRLVTIFDANTSRLEEKLNKVIRSNYAAAKKVENSWKNSPVSAGLADLTKQITGAADALPGLGAGLGAAGAAGIAAAASIGVLTAALAAAKGAAAFGDEIADSAAKVGISTDALQEYRYAIHATGGEDEGRRRSAIGLHADAWQGVAGVVEGGAGVQGDRH